MEEPLLQDDEVANALNVGAQPSRSSQVSRPPQEDFQRKWEKAEEEVSNGKDESEGLDENRAFALERELDNTRWNCIHKLHSVETRPRIAIAFSGGGQRAASFACGLLWALAEEKWLPSVRHISAVSGGGYTASLFGAHLKEHSEKHRPKEGEDLHDWYLGVVEKCLLHMQNNISHLVGSPRNGLLRLSFNTFIFCVASIGSMVVNAITFTMYSVVPFTTFLTMEIGPQMRSDFCCPAKTDARGGMVVSRTYEAWTRSLPIQSLPFVLVLALVLGLCKVRPDENPAWSCRNAWFGVTRALRLISKRWVKLVFWYILAVFFVILRQQLTVGFANNTCEVQRKCKDYIANAALSHPKRCTDWYIRAGSEHRHEAWYQDLPDPYPNSTWCSEHRQHEHRDAQAPWDPASIFDYRPKGIQEIVRLVCVALAFLALVAAVLRLHVLNDILHFLGPATNLYLLTAFAQWKVYGPITGQSLLWGGAMRYSDDSSASFFSANMIYIIFTIPFLGYILESAHIINTWGLKRAHYPKGREEMLLKDVCDIYNPNIIFGSCVQDWGRPLHRTPYDDFELTPLYLGGRRTGYWPTAHTRMKLVTAVGVSGAATDIVMSTSHSSKARWWVSMLSLRMGAWVRVREWHRIFQRTTPVITTTLSGHKISQFMDKRTTLREMCEEFAKRSVGMITQIFWFFLVWYVSMEFPKGGCHHLVLFRLLFTGFAVFFVLLHMHHVPSHHVVNCIRHLCRKLRSRSGRSPSNSSMPGSGPSDLLRSPLMRNTLMMFGHFHKSWSVPEYLYLVDGGVMDSLGVLALLRRKERWIIALDAAGPANDPCRFIRECMNTAIDTKLCSFADPKGSGRYFGYLLEEYERDHAQAVLHLRIIYEPNQTPAVCGDIFFVRMRIPPDCSEPQKGLLCKPDQESPMGTAQVQGQAGNTPALRRDLHGALCCDSCHDSRCIDGCARTCCGRFPLPAMANQFLTSRMFAELCHLGRELGTRAISTMSEEMQRVDAQRNP